MLTANKRPGAVARSFMTDDEYYSPNVFLIEAKTLVSSLGFAFGFALASY